MKCRKQHICSKKKHHRIFVERNAKRNRKVQGTFDNLSKGQGIPMGYPTFPQPYDPYVFGVCWLWRGVKGFLVSPARHGKKNMEKYAQL